ncbi:hypothetical protein [Prevotella histicola]|uniref:hypothetical protein n=1 Tax=Prevotella histicola TaxID=470565 RepID=UPI001C5FB246|nr:hypothetical protein [Prevotella histicola]MBW4774432.1 hypothetical protein [Prevotella histicola]
MKEIKTLFKKDYIRPHVAVFDVAEDSHLLVSSPNVRPGAGGSPAGTVTVEPLTPVDGGDDDDLVG